MSSRGHKDWLEFLRKAADLPIGYSIDDLIWFKTIAERQYPALAPLVSACIYLVQQSDMKIAAEGLDLKGSGKEESRHTEPSRNPEPISSDLSSLFMSQELFPRNNDLATFALRLMPDMRSYRFDKMSRGEIASRLVQHVERLDSKKRIQLETALREAVSALGEKSADTRSFVSKWENIIKSIKL